MKVAHAPASPYGPYLLLDGVGLQKVLRLETDFRTPPVATSVLQVFDCCVFLFCQRVVCSKFLLFKLQTLADRLQLPWIVLGDFNSPSALDWTSEVAEKRKLPFAVNWPLSAALQRMGAHDVFREVEIKLSLVSLTSFLQVHSDPVAVPGFTWTPWGPEARQHDICDRVDWILRGPRGVTALVSFWLCVLCLLSRACGCVCVRTL